MVAQATREQSSFGRDRGDGQENFTTGKYKLAITDFPVVKSSCRIELLICGQTTSLTRAAAGAPCARTFRNNPERSRSDLRFWEVRDLR